ncbi:hypothetical protein L218DRAFT_852060 [Marasmius fiardii PR-910]|nr:hypothetical protein L218DRAFT_852060 [Marasmius fiardii PR-910]
MSLCSICLETLKAPVAIPCGHVFCDNCLLNAVTAKKLNSSMNSCPTCRTPFSIVNIDPALVPAHLQPYVVPSIRKLYMDDATSQNSEPTPASSSFVISEYNRLVAENKALKTNCWVWRRRAETHAAATIGLLNVARITKERAEQLQHEKEELERDCSILKKELQE